MAVGKVRADVLGAARHGFFTREGGVSEGVYASLNCGAGSDDDPDRVAENRARALAALADGDARAAVDLRGVHQVHSATAVDAADCAQDRPRADALASADPGLALSILTADCAPILLHDPAAGVAGAAHAGWRGALDGIIEAVVARMDALGAARRSIRAAIGPCISQRAYEVGEEFLERFCDEDPDHSRFFAGGPGGRPHFDLPGFCLHRLREAGVAEAEWTGHCTFHDEARFFSYRRKTHRDEPDYGRQISIILTGA